MGLRALLLVALHGLAAGQTDIRSTYPAASRWRVVNAECLCDHWNIGELEMLDENAESTKELIRSVECSYDYSQGAEPLSVVHDGNWFTGGGAQPGTWAGLDGEACGSWLGFTFARPVSIYGVNMAQGEWECQRVGMVSLEAMVNEEWQHVTYVHFSTSPDSFVGSVDGWTADRPVQCTAKKTGCEQEMAHGGFDPAFLMPIFIAVFLVLMIASQRRRIMEWIHPPPPATLPMPPQQQPMAVPMQQPALAVAAPVQQPALPAYQTSVMVTCPIGLKPGDALQVGGPAGQMMQVQVPLGVAPGGQFAVQMPAAPVGMAAQPGVAMAAQVQARVQSSYYVQTTDPSGVVMTMPATAHETIAAQATAAPVPVTTQPSNKFREMARAELATRP